MEPEMEQLALLSFWRKENTLTAFCDQKLDELYLKNPTLFEDYARLNKGSSFVRAVCFEVLRRHRNFRVSLPPDDQKLTKTITTYDVGLLDLRREWAIYRIERAEDPQDMFNQIKASEPQNAVFFEDLAKLPFAKTDGVQTPKLLNDERSTPAQKPMMTEVQPPFPVTITILVVASAMGLLWLVFKNRNSSKNK